MICANCEHEQSRHKGGTDGCRKCDLGCTGFELPEGAALEQDLAELEATDPAVAEAAARLDETTVAVVEKVRPDALDDLLDRVRRQDAVDNAEHQRVHGDCLTRQAKLIGTVVEARNDGESTSARLRRVEQERDELAAQLKTAEWQRDGHAHTSDMLRAELASARTELEQLRTSPVRVNTAPAGPTHPAISVLTRFLCETCGARYGQPFTDHEHGPLTPVVITMTRKGAL